MNDKQPCVYILAAAPNRAVSVGVTSNLLKRIAEHGVGVIDGHTEDDGIRRLVWFEQAETMEAAILHEKKRKRWRRDWKRHVIERDYSAWNDQAVGFGFPSLSTD